MTYRFKSCRGHSTWRKDLRRMAVSPFFLGDVDWGAELGLHGDEPLAAGMTLLAEDGSWHGGKKRSVVSVGDPAERVRDTKNGLVQKGEGWRCPAHEFQNCSIWTWTASLSQRHSLWDVNKARSCPHSRSVRFARTSLILRESPSAAQPQPKGKAVSHQQSARNPPCRADHCTPKGQGFRGATHGEIPGFGASSGPQGRSFA